MTSAKIKTLLTDIYNISSPLNRWLKLTPKINVIHLNQDADIFLSNNTICYFDSGNETIIISNSKRGAYKNIDLETTHQTKKDAFNENLSYFTFDKVGGFIASLILGPGGVYTKRPY